MNRRKFSATMSGQLQPVFKSGEIMRSKVRAILVGILTVSTWQAISTPRASAQSFGSGGSLGGYGGSMGNADSNMGTSGPIIPYAGKFSGFMPSRMSSGGSSLSFQSRGNSAMGSNRTSFSLAPPGGMSLMSGGMGGSFRSLSSLGSQGGMRLDGGMGGGRRGQTSSTSGMGVMPPNFGYPFYQPPSLLSPSSSGSGMSM